MKSGKIPYLALGIAGLFALVPFAGNASGETVDLIDTSGVAATKLPQKELAALRELLFPEPTKSDLEKDGDPSSLDWSDDLDSGFGVKTDAIVVVHKGKVIFEEYQNGYHAEMPHRLWSVGKSVTSSFVGMAIQEGKLGIDESICKYIEAPKKRSNSAHCDITIRNVLHWSSSLKWQESYASLNPKRSSVLAMLYGEGHKDMAKFVFGHGMEGPAGKHFTYSTGDTNLLWAVLRRVYGETEYETLPWTKLFDKIGLSNVTIERDPTGLYSGGSHIFMKPRDLARYAQFFLNGGVVKGESLLPQNWLGFSATMAPSMAGRGGSDPNGDNIPGAHWWVNQNIPERGIERPWPDAPADTFAGLGVFGQTVMIMPSEELIVVRLGQDLISGFDRNELAKRALALVK